VRFDGASACTRGYLLSALLPSLIFPPSGVSSGFVFFLRRIGCELVLRGLIDNFIWIIAIAIVFRGHENLSIRGVTVEARVMINQDDAPCSHPSCGGEWLAMLEGQILNVGHMMCRIE